MAKPKPELTLLATFETADKYLVEALSDGSLVCACTGTPIPERVTLGQFAAERKSKKVLVCEHIQEAILRDFDMTWEASDMPDAVTVPIYSGTEVDFAKWGLRRYTSDDLIARITLHPSDKNGIRKIAMNSRPIGLFTRFSGRKDLRLSALHALTAWSVALGATMCMADFHDADATKFFLAGSQRMMHYDAYLRTSFGTCLHCATGVIPLAPDAF